MSECYRIYLHSPNDLHERFFEIASEVHPECEVVESPEEADIVVVDQEDYVGDFDREGLIIAIVGREPIRSQPGNVIHVRTHQEIKFLFTVLDLGRKFATHSVHS